MATKYFVPRATDEGQLGTDVELAKWSGERGIFFGGSVTNEINYITIHIYTYFYVCLWHNL